MRQINKIIIHCSDTPNFIDYDAEDINDWHVDRGWDGCGYHKVFPIDGSVQDHTNSPARNPKEIGAHAEGHNDDSLGFCLIGKNRFFEKQIVSLLLELIQAYSEYGITPIDIYGHYEFNDGKTCPGFDIKFLRLLFNERLRNPSLDS